MKSASLKPARPVRPLPREQSDTLLLLFSSVLVLAPHCAYLPPWVCVSSALILLWRTAITLRGARLPPLWLLLSCALLALSGVCLSFGTLFGRDAGVAMLALLLSFKLLEMQTRRDVLSVIFLSFFLLLCNFFHSQTMLTALLTVATVIVLLTAQMSFQYTGVVPPLTRRLRLGASIFAIAAPLGAILFIAVPRIQGPLWGMAQDDGNGRSGLSESMAPGTLASLALSQEPAFRVRFAGPAPAQSQLYWRGYVLGDFDGRTWTRIKAQSTDTRARAVKLKFEGAPVRYHVTASRQRTLTALEMVLQPPRIGGVEASTSSELELLAPRDVRQPMQYDAVSYLNFSLQADETVEHLEQWQNLPAGFNPRTLAFALSMQRQDPAQSIHAVLAWFQKNHFKYTLQAPLLGKNAVDDFLFISKAGFCEHYASAFAVIMRAMDIPARIVTGYQGGTADPADASLTVRQADAHAWTEVWLAGRGWLRIDPTAAIAPERLEHKLAPTLPPAMPFGLKGLAELLDAQADNHWSQLASSVDMLNHAWRLWVLDYNPQRQRSLLQKFAGNFVHWPPATAATMLLAGLCCALTAVLTLGMSLRRRHRPDALEALYRTFCRQQARRGCARAPDEGPSRYAERLVLLARTPGQKAAFEDFLQLYGRLKYGAVRPNEKKSLLRNLQRLLTQTR